MTNLRTMPQTFVGGEIGPSMLGRPDDPKYQTGARRLRRFLVDPTGTARVPPGTVFVNSSRNPDRRARLITYRLGGGQSMKCEFGLRQEYPGSSTVPGYVRFHRAGGSVLHGVPWSSASAYVVGDHVLSGGVLYRCKLAHTNQAPPNTTYWISHAYVQNRTFASAAPAPPTSGITTGTPGEIFFGTGNAHGLVNDDPVQITGDLAATPPGGITYGTTYFAEVVDTERIRLRATPGGGAIAITTVGTGTHRMHRIYFDTELVSRSGFVFYCKKTRPIDGAGLSIPPDSGNETYWYQQPATGELEIPTTLALTEDELFAMTHSQDGRVLTLATRRSPAAELRRQSNNWPLSLYTWAWSQVAFAPPIAAPTGVVATAAKRGATIEVTAAGHLGVSSYVRVATTFPHNLVPGLDAVLIEGLGAGLTAFNAKHWLVGEDTAYRFLLLDPETGAPITTTINSVAGGTVRVVRLHSDLNNSYVVTAVNEDGRESAQSAVATIFNALSATGAYNTITWNAVAGAVRYHVYKLIAGSGLYGIIGKPIATSFDDRFIGAQLDETPPTLDTSLANGLGTSPGAVTHNEGRRFFAGSDSEPRTVWGVRSNTESDLSYSIPSKATDRIKQTLKSRFPCTILHLVPAGGRLAALSDTTEFRIGPVDTEALTPDSFAAGAQSYIGAGPAQPVVMQNVVLFASASGGHVYQMGWRDEVGGYLTTSLCERAAHLFDGYSIVQMAEQLTPVPMVWCLRSDGKLLALTFVPSQSVWAWHWHDTDGFIESVAVGGEDGEERLDLLVRRTINGATKRYVERVASLRPTAWNDSWFVDCGLRYSGAPATVIAGLTHLEGKTVAVFADGQMQAQKVVAGGQITLDVAASQVLVGLPMQAELQTLPGAFAIEAHGSGRPKNVVKVWIRVEKSGPFEVGIDENNVLPVDPAGNGGVFSGLVEVSVPSEWVLDGQVFIRQPNPLPLTIVSVTAEMAIGG